MTAAAIASAHQQFEAALPAIRQTARYALRRRRRRDRDDLLAEAIACAWKAWRGLVARGKNPVVVGVTAIAGWAARHALNGRRIGNRHGGRHKMDVHHRRARHLGGYEVISYDSGPAARSDDGPAAWRDWVATDRHMGPADAAAFRVDFACWLASLPDRRRRTAELLAEGHGTLDVARWVGVTPAAVSQARSWLARSWQDFQGGTPAAGAHGPRPSCPRPRGHGGVRIGS
jgi:DNA-directed RNA polymerase specialized sigma24 family protein